MNKNTKATSSKKQSIVSDENLDLAMLCAKSAIDKKALHSILFDVSKVGAFTDHFFITSGSNEKQVQAIADEIAVQARAAGYGRARMEGYDEGRWILLDLGSVVVHVFHEYIRSFYNLEDLWGHSKRVQIPEEFYTTPQANSPRLV